VTAGAETASVVVSGHGVSMVGAVRLVRACEVAVWVPLITFQTAAAVGERVHTHRASITAAARPLMTTVAVAPSVGITSDEPRVPAAVLKGVALEVASWVGSAVCVGTAITASLRAVELGRAVAAVRSSP
jgi:hypothetical protein